MRGLASILRGSTRTIRPDEQGTTAVAAALLGVCVLGALSVGAGARSVASRGVSTDGRIAFQADIRGATQIFTIRPDRTGVEQVTDLRTDDPGPGAENAA